MAKYSLTLRLIHWVMALILLSLLGIGFWMTDLPGDYPDKYSVIYPMHKSFGLLAFAFVLLRISARLTSTIPNYEEYKIKKLEILSAKVVHGCFYLCMLVIPLSGYFMSTFGGHPVAFFGLRLPAMKLADPALQSHLAAIARDVHGLGGVILVTLVALHLLGTLKHVILDKQAIFSRMWF